LRVNKEGPVFRPAQGIMRGLVVCLACLFILVCMSPMAPGMGTATSTSSAACLQPRCLDDEGTSRLRTGEGPDQSVTSPIALRTSGAGPDAGRDEDARMVSVSQVCPTARA